MKAQQLLTLLALSPLAAHALPRRRHQKCGRPSTTSTTIITTGVPLSEIPTFTAVPVESLPTSTYTTDSITEILTPTTTVTTGVPLSEIPTFTAVPAESLPTSIYTTDSITVTTGLPLTEIPSFTAIPADSLTSVTTFTTFTLTTSTEGSYPVASSVEGSYPVASSVEGSYPVASPVVAAADAAFAEATPVAFRVKATEQCGDDDRLILPGMPWTVANSMYNADQMVGKQCTNFGGILETEDGTKEVSWRSVTDVDLVDDTKNLCKGYTNIGVGVNLNNRLRDIKSIPAYYKWDRTITADFKGSNLFDFITAPTSGDHTSTATSEFMLWIRNWGGQVPIGWSRGPVASLKLFGVGWKLYEGVNPGSGVTVRSLLADEDYEGVFTGDLKEWLDAMADRGYISDADYVTVGNAGTEIFYGKSVMEATVALDIKI